MTKRVHICTTVVILCCGRYVIKWRENLHIGDRVRVMEQEENLDTKNAISEMKSAINQMDNIFIPSIRETAKLVKIKLD